VGRPRKYESNAERQDAYRRRKKHSKRAIFSSESDNWETPQPVFDDCNREFGPFDLDAAASADNRKVDRFYSLEQDSLTQEWSGRVWLNPPYGRYVYQWIRKAYLSAKSGALVVCLLPVRTDTRWFHDFVLPYGEIRFFPGRLKFGNSRNSAPFPSMLVVFSAISAELFQP